MLMHFYNLLPICGASAAICLSLLTQHAATASSNDWVIDPKASKIKFVAKTGTSIRAIGTFTDVSGKLTYRPSSPASFAVSAEIPLRTLSTGVNVRDEDLIGPKYFDIRRFPMTTFTAKQLVKNRDGSYRISGQLTLRGLTRAVDVHAPEPKISIDKTGRRTLSVVGAATIDQSNFGLSLIYLHPRRDVWINKDIAITIELRASERTR